MTERDRTRDPPQTTGGADRLVLQRGDDECLDTVTVFLEITLPGTNAPGCMRAVRASHAHRPSRLRSTNGRECYVRRDSPSILLNKHWLPPSTVAERSRSGRRASPSRGGRKVALRFPSCREQPIRNGNSSTANTHRAGNLSPMAARSSSGIRKREANGSSTWRRIRTSAATLSTTAGTGHALICGVNDWSRSSRSAPMITWSRMDAL